MSHVVTMVHSIQIIKQDNMGPDPDDKDFLPEIPYTPMGGKTSKFHPPVKDKSSKPNLPVKNKKKNETVEKSFFKMAGNKYLNNISAGSFNKQVLLYSNLPQTF